LPSVAPQADRTEVDADDDDDDDDDGDDEGENRAGLSEQVSVKSLSPTFSL